MNPLRMLIGFYYRLAGTKLLYVFVLMATAVSFEGFGLGLFLPIIEGEKAESPVTVYVNKIFSALGIEYALHYLLFVLVVFFFLRSACLIAQEALVGKIAAELLVTLRTRITQKIFELDYLFFVRKPSGYLNNAVVVEFQRAGYALEMFVGIFVAVLFALLYLSIPLILNPVLVVLLAVLGVPLFVLIRIINDVTKNYSINKTARTAGLQKILIQSLHNYKYLKATAEYPSILGHVAAESRALGMIEFKEKRLAAFAEFGFEPFIILIVAGVIFYNVEIRGQDLLRNLFLLYLLYNALKRILAIQSRYRKLLNAWGSIGVVNVLESETERHREETRRAPGISAVPFDCPIVFENVVFSFNGGAPVLKNLSIEIPPNTTVAIVGESGGGKTTLVNLLVGLLRPTSGVIRIGDVSYSELDRHEFRKKIGYITQETALFNDTIRNNITLWGDARSGSDENVRAAAARAHIDDFIEGLESGYDTVLGEGGITVSGGQRQRLCIARELYKDARLLIFDEATSSLDSATEKEIQKNIDELRGEKTVVLVAHRLSTVRNADRIFCLKDGTVVEAGTYAELYAAGGEFRRMVDQQNA